MDAPENAPAKESVDGPEKEPDFPVATTKSDRLISISGWLTVIVTGIVCLALLYKSFIDVGPTIHVAFSGEVALERDKTPIKYKGVDIGKVKRITLSTDMKKVIVDIELYDFAWKFATEGAQFWIVKPEISAAGIEGIETLTSGSFIGADPGTGAKKTEFEGVAENPDKAIQPNDLSMTLFTDKITKLNPGSPVLYRGVTVGEVSKVDLDKRGDRVRVGLFIRSPYKNLVNSSSRFWYSSGIQASFGLFSGAKFDVASLPTLLNGSIAFITPDPNASRAIRSLTLYDSFDEKWQPAANGSGQDSGAPKTRGESNADPGVKYDYNR